MSELTPEEVWRLSQAGLGEVFPYSVLIPAPDAGGIGLWSWFPLAAVSAKQPYTAIAAARLQVPGVRFDPLVASVHVISPVTSTSDIVGDWRTGIAAIRAALNDFADAAGQAA